MAVIKVWFCTKNTFTYHHAYHIPITAGLSNENRI